MLKAIFTMALSTTIGACTAGKAANEPNSSAPVPSDQDLPAPPPNSHDPRQDGDDDPVDEPAPFGVLVTGFNDWKDLGTPPNVWRCRDNPSCRVILGAASSTEPTTIDGPLMAALAKTPATTPDGRPIAWAFTTLPVTWGIAQRRAHYDAYDVVIHLGLGVYDRKDVFFVEDGAVNLQRGTDADGQQRSGPINEQVGEVLSPPKESGISDKVRALNGKRFGDYEVKVMAARQANSYLCNETHFWALDAVHQSRASGGRLAQAFFVHIPYAMDTDDGYERLASGLAGVVSALAH